MATPASFAMRRSVLHQIAFLTSTSAALIPTVTTIVSAAPHGCQPLVVVDAGVARAFKAKLADLQCFLRLTDALEIACILYTLSDEHEISSASVCNFSDAADATIAAATARVNLISGTGELLRGLLTVERLRSERYLAGNASSRQALDLLLRQLVAVLVTKFPVHVWHPTELIKLFRVADRLELRSTLAKLDWDSAVNAPIANLWVLLAFPRRSSATHHVDFIHTAQLARMLFAQCDGRLGNPFEALRDKKAALSVVSGVASCLLNSRDWSTNDDHPKLLIWMKDVLGSKEASHFAVDAWRDRKRSSALEETPAEDASTIAAVVVIATAQALFTPRHFSWRLLELLTAEISAGHSVIRRMYPAEALLLSHFGTMRGSSSSQRLPQILRSIGDIAKLLRAPVDVLVHLLGRLPMDSQFDSDDDDLSSALHAWMLTTSTIIAAKRPSVDAETIAHLVADVISARPGAETATSLLPLLDRLATVLASSTASSSWTGGVGVDCVAKLHDGLQSAGGATAHPALFYALERSIAAQRFSRHHSQTRAAFTAHGAPNSATAPQAPRAPAAPPLPLPPPMPQQRPSFEFLAKLSTAQLNEMLRSRPSKFMSAQILALANRRSVSSVPKAIRSVAGRLGFDRNDVKRAFTDAALKFHPDTALDGADASLRFRVLVAARDALLASK